MDHLEQHKQKWNSLAEENDRYYVRSVDYEQSDEEYEESGRANVNAFIENDRLLMSRLTPLSERYVLEIGCGSGRVTKTLAKFFKGVEGIDISSVMLEKARKFVKNSNTIFVESSGDDVPALPEIFDLAFSYIVYQHFPSREAVENSFNGVWRALKPGGLFKVQLRGLEHADPRHWSWGPHYTHADADSLISATRFFKLDSSGEGTRSYWLLLEKPHV